MQDVINQVNELFAKYRNGEMTESECLAQVILACAVEQTLICDAIKTKAIEIKSISTMCSLDRQYAHEFGD